MTQEEKQLLLKLKDLCARLPYDILAECGTDYDFQNNITDTVKLSSLDIDSKLCKIKLGNYVFNVSLDNIKPYLRPMSSMTEEEKEEYCNLQARFLCSSQYPVTDAYELFDWLNEHYFDYRGLIEKGLALEAPEEMYKV